MVRTSEDGSVIIGDSWRELGIDADERLGQQKTYCPNCHLTRNNKRDKSLSVNTQQGIANCHYCSIRYLVDSNTKNYSTVDIKKEYKLPKQDISYDINEKDKNLVFSVCQNSPEVMTAFIEKIWDDICVDFYQTFYSKEPAE